MNKTKQKLLKISQWTLKIISALMIFLFGLNKVMSVESWANWGYSLNFMLFIGVMEILGAVGLLIPKLSSFAALGLSIIVIGAAFAHLRRDFSPLMPVILLGLFIVIFIIGFPKRIFKKK